MGHLSRVQWDTYLHQFHHDHPGITEAVLTRTHDDGQNPYEWLCADLPADATILDLACGSAPTRPLTGTGWVGLDANISEVASSRHDTHGRTVLADLGRLPVAGQSIDVVTCSMALMLIDPIDRALAELRRTLRPNGLVRILLPTTGPLTHRDHLRYLRLATSLRTAVMFPPNPILHDAAALLSAADLRIIDDHTRRFAFPVTSAADARLLVDSLYLPTTGPDRRRAANRAATRWAGHEVGLPLRRITAAPTG